MGTLDQFAKATFALDTEQITGGAIAWEGPQEVGLTEVRLDGLLSIRTPARAAELPAPWNTAAQHADVVVEVKMPGDHLHPLAIRRSELRRAAWHVRRTMKEGAEWEGSVGLWLVAPHVPPALSRLFELHPKGAGCYALGSPLSSSWWIAANELPLHDALIPFLIARSGRALDELGRWVVGRRSPEWIMNMLQWLPMSPATEKEILRQLRADPPPAVVRRRKRLERMIQEMNAAERKELEQTVRTEATRDSLLRVLVRRGFELSNQQRARITACRDSARLERWFDRAVTAGSVDEALA